MWSITSRLDRGWPAARNTRAAPTGFASEFALTGPGSAETAGRQQQRGDAASSRFCSSRASPVVLHLLSPGWRKYFSDWTVNVPHALLFWRREADQIFARGRRGPQRRRGPGVRPAEPAFPRRPGPCLNSPGVGWGGGASPRPCLRQRPTRGVLPGLAPRTCRSGLILRNFAKNCSRCRSKGFHLSPPKQRNTLKHKKTRFMLFCFLVSRKPAGSETRAGTG